MAEKEGEVTETAAETTETAAETTETVAETAEETTAAPETKAAPAVDAAAIAAAVAAALPKPGAAPLSEEQIEQQWKALEEQWGMPRAAIVKMDEHAKRVALNASLPYAEEAGSARAEKIVKDPELLEKVRAEMKGLPPEVRANPVAWEKAAYMVRGQFGDTVKKKTGAERPAGKVVGGGAEGGNKVELSEKGGASRQSGGGKTKKIEDYSPFEQAIIRTSCGGDVEAYERYRAKESTKTGGSLPREGGNRADQALRSLTKGRRD